MGRIATKKFKLICMYVLIHIVTHPLLVHETHTHASMTCAYGLSS